MYSSYFFKIWVLIMGLQLRIYRFVDLAVSIASNVASVALGRVVSLSIPVRVLSSYINKTYRVSDSYKITCTRAYRFSFYFTIHIKQH